MSGAELEKIKRIITDLQTYCFCTQSTFKGLGYDFVQKDFDRLYMLMFEYNKLLADNVELEKALTDMVEINTEKVTKKSRFEFICEVLCWVFLIGGIITIVVKSICEMGG